MEAAINFPNIFSRFCGQGFLERDDRELAAECLRIYNDWMIDDWGEGSLPSEIVQGRVFGCIFDDLVG